MLMHRAFLHSVTECMWIPMYTSIGAGGGNIRNHIFEKMFCSEA